MMNKVYNLGWLEREMYDNYILSVYDKSSLIGIYQMDQVLTNSLDEFKIKFANIDDLTKFITNSLVRFRQIINPDNFLDMPISYLSLFDESSTLIGDEDRFVDRNTLGMQGLMNGELLHDPVTISIHKVADNSPELSEIIKLTKEFINLDMASKMDALNRINLINYNREKVQE